MNKPTHGGARRPGPGKRLGRPLGAVSAEPTIRLVVYVPAVYGVPFREKWGKRTAERLRALIAADVGHRG